LLYDTPTTLLKLPSIDLFGSELVDRWVSDVMDLGALVGTVSFGAFCSGRLPNDDVFFKRKSNHILLLLILYCCVDLDKTYFAFLQQELLELTEIFRAQLFI
jgi:hypothetical protein